MKQTESGIMEQIFDNSLKPAHDLQYTRYGWEGTISTPFSEFDVPVSARDGSEDYIQRCAAAFLQMSEELLDRLLRATAAYALDTASGDSLYDEETGFEFTESSPPRDILKFICPVRLVIKPTKLLSEEDMPPAFVVEFNCGIDPDAMSEGLEWAVKDGEPVYAGGYIGCDPWEYYPGEDNYINGL